MDPELEAALDVLGHLSQAEVAAEIGISERRLRDIERGRSRPRSRTREAILRLADDLRAGNPRKGESDSWEREGSANSQQPHEASDAEALLSGGQVNPLWAMVVAALLVAGIAALVWFGRQPNDE